MFLYNLRNDNEVRKAKTVFFYLIEAVSVQKSLTALFLRLNLCSFVIEKLCSLHFYKEKHF